MFRISVFERIGCMDDSMTPNMHTSLLYSCQTTVCKKFVQTSSTPGFTVFVKQKVGKNTWMTYDRHFMSTIP